MSEFLARHQKAFLEKIKAHLPTGFFDERDKEQIEKERKFLLTSARKSLNSYKLELPRDWHTMLMSLQSNMQHAEFLGKLDGVSNMAMGKKWSSNEPAAVYDRGGRVAACETEAGQAAGPSDVKKDVIKFTNKFAYDDSLNEDMSEMMTTSGDARVPFLGTEALTGFCDVLVRHKQAALQEVVNVIMKQGDGQFGVLYCIGAALSDLAIAAQTNDSEWNPLEPLITVIKAELAQGFEDPSELAGLVEAKKQFDTRLAALGGLCAVCVVMGIIDYSVAKELAVGSVLRMKEPAFVRHPFFAAALVSGLLRAVPVVAIVYGIDLSSSAGQEGDAGDLAALVGLITNSLELAHAVGAWCAEQTDVATGGAFVKAQVDTRLEKALDKKTPFFVTLKAFHTQDV